MQAVESSVEVESFDLDAEMLGITLVKPVSLSARGLMSYVSYLNKNGLDAQRYETELWSRVARTATVVIMPALALLRITTGSEEIQARQQAAPVISPFSPKAMAFMPPTR